MGKNKSILLGAVLLFALVVIIAVLAGGFSEEEYSQSALFAPEASFDFGAVPIDGGKVSHIFELRNEGAEPVKIEKIYTSCACTQALVKDSDAVEYGPFGMQGHGFLSRTDIRVGAGESVAVEGIFDPAAHGPSGIGLAERSIYIKTNSSTVPMMELSLRALVVNSADVGD